MIELKSINKEFYYFIIENTHGMNQIHQFNEFIENYDTHVMSISSSSEFKYRFYVMFRRFGSRLINLKKKPSKILLKITQKRNF